MCLSEHKRDYEKSGRGDGLEEETGAKLVLTLSSDEDFDEGILILSGMDKLIDKYGVDNIEITITQGGLYKKAEFRLFGIKFSGYMDDERKGS